MNLLLISCLLLFVIYFSIAGLLVYYFFRARDTWNIFFDEIYQDFQSMASGCFRHNTFGLLIPGFIYSSSTSNDTSDSGCGDCSECAREDKIRKSNLYNVKILADIYVLFRTLDTNMLEDVNISSRCRMFQLLLEYIIRNYTELCSGDYTLYERLQMVYLDKDISPRLNNSSKGIEIIPILEEYFDILDKLNTICNEINIEMVQGTFMIAFYQNFRIFIIDSRNYLSEFLGLKG